MFMEYTYMIVAFTRDFEIDEIVEPPKYPHLTIKKKFKIIGINEDELITQLQKTTQKFGECKLELGGDKVYDDPAFMVVEVLNADDWKQLHLTLMKALEKDTESRDPHFEGENYYPHISWMVRNEIMLDPKPLHGKTFDITKLYLIQRIDPVISRVRVIAKLNLQ